jgi:hypothetical protein
VLSWEKILMGLQGKISFCENLNTNIVDLLKNVNLCFNGYRYYLDPNENVRYLIDLARKIYHEDRLIVNEMFYEVKELEYKKKTIDLGENQRGCSNFN